MATIAESYRDWKFETDGVLDGRYIETRQVHISSGASAGQTKTVVDYKVNGETVTVWPSTVLLNRFREELERRGKPDFEPGEQMKIGRSDQKHPNGYWTFPVLEFEHAAPKPSAADLFATGASAEPYGSDVAADLDGLAEAKRAAGIGEPERSTGAPVGDDDIPF